MSLRQKYRMFRRGNVFWAQDNDTGKQESLGTKNREEAHRLLHAKNEAHRQPVMNLEIARAYLLASDPNMSKRTWGDAMQEIVRVIELKKKPPTISRWHIAIKDSAFDSLRDLPLLETRREHFINAIEAGKVSTNVYLQRIHNYSFRAGWLPKPVIPKLDWPKCVFKQKRAITDEEHDAIVAAEQNPERRAFYELCWYLGGAQSDVANLAATDIDWNTKTVSFQRRKTGAVSMIRIGPDVEAILRSLPHIGLLFPKLAIMREAHRATEFRRCCRRVRIPVCPTFLVDDIADVKSLAEKVVGKSDPVSMFLWERFSNDITVALEQYVSKKGNIAELKATLVTALNRIIATGALYDAEVFSTVKRRHETVELQSEQPQGINLQRLNRMLLEDAYVMEFSRGYVSGVSLHSYRYAWAERARKAGYPERFAQEALGHNSAAVHRSYSRQAQVTLPSLQQYEEAAKNGKITPVVSASVH